MTTLASIPSRLWKLIDGPRVYFLGAEGGLIKTGRTRNVRQRMTALRIASGQDLHLWAVSQLEPVSNALEGMYHRHFAASRVRGEWFSRSAELVDLILDHQRMMPVRDGNREWFTRCPEIEAEIARLEDSCRRAAA